MQMQLVHHRLQDCIRRKDLIGGKEILSIVQHSTELQADSLLCTHLIRLLALCGNLQEAHRFFNGLPKNNPSTWRAIITAHSKFGNTATTLALFGQMLCCHVPPELHTFIAAIRACSKINLYLDRAMIIHSHAVESELDSDVYLGSTLIDMYVKCGRFSDAENVLHGLDAGNVVSWTAIISGYAHHGQGHCALRLFDQMQKCGIEPNYVTYVSVFKACASITALEYGRLSHNQFIDMNPQLIRCESVLSTLIDMYMKCGMVQDAKDVFDSQQSRGVVTWSALIAGYVQAGHGLEAFFSFQQMQYEGVGPCHFTFVSILAACSESEILDQGRFFHALIHFSYLEFDIYIGNALVHMYTRCGDIKMASMIFSQLPKRDVVTWSSMIAGCTEEGNCADAFSMFVRMLVSGMEPDKVMFGSLLKACSRMAAINEGMLIHSDMIECGCETEVFIGNSLVDMYAKCGRLGDARAVFEKLPKQNIVTWSALIAGHVQLGHDGEALHLFQEMKGNNIVPDDTTLVCMLKACSSGQSLDQGKIIHEQSIHSCNEDNVFIENTLIGLYIKSGKLEDALEMFDNMHTRHPIHWSAMIFGLAENGYCHAALRLFQQMRQEGIEPDTVIYGCVLKACSKLAALEQGKLIHAQISNEVCENDCFIGSILIDMYANCGDIAKAHLIFQKLGNKNVVAWSSIVAGFAENGDYDSALHYFKCMQKDGVKPVDVTYTSMLSVCNQRGLLKDGCYHFDTMTREHGIQPTIAHYNCMIDLFGRVGLLQEARDMLLTMPIIPGLVAWTSLLSHCRIHGYVDLGNDCYEKIVKIDERHASSYELMSKLYTDDGRIDDAEKLQEKRKSAHAWKKIGEAFIEVNNQIYNFRVGDQHKEETINICHRLHVAGMQMKEDGYVPLVDSILHVSFDSGDDDSWHDQLSISG